MAKKSTDNASKATIRSRASGGSAGAISELSTAGATTNQAPPIRVAWGGVSAIPAKAAAYGLTALFDHTHASVTNAASANPGFRWNGGPVVSRPQVFSSFWGKTWSTSANAKRVDRFNLYLKDLLQSKYMNILTQYGVG